jgi:hypothetical protein
LADAAHPPGTIEPVTTGLIKGYIDRLAPADDATNVSLQSWIALCRKAYATMSAMTAHQPLAKAYSDLAERSRRIERYLAALNEKSWADFDES